MIQQATEQLSAAETARLVEFARACKAAARVVTLYPGGHPAIATTLARIAQVTSAEQLPAPLRIGVLADSLLLDGKPMPRTDPAIGELATLLHDHLIGELTVQPGGDVEAWRAFLLLLGRPADVVRAEGGVARLWLGMAGHHIELREIDYSEVLRERRGGIPSSWEQIIASCLERQVSVPSEEIIRSLLEASRDADTVNGLIAALDMRAAEAGQSLPARAAALVRLLQRMIDAVRKENPDRLQPVMQDMATAVGRLSPDMLASLLAMNGDAAVPAEAGGDRAAAGIVEGVVSHMSDTTIAGFVARNALAPDASIDRVAHVFQTLVRDGDQRERLLELAHDEAAGSAIGSTEGFEEAWDEVAQKMLTSYSDKPFVSDQYARELTNARTQAVDVSQLHDDPPERMNAWMGSIATSELRALDLALLLDLLRIEDRADRWVTMVGPVVGVLEDLFLVGDIDATETLLAALVAHTAPDVPGDRRQASRSGVEKLVAGPMMQHIVAHLPALDEASFKRVKAMCLSLGEVLIRPLAEALSAESSARTRDRLAAILIGFGAVGRREVERLKLSPNPAVRRTAIYLLREFGGSEALPELTELLKDADPEVQREAVRAILNIGSDRAFQVLEQALSSGSESAREAIMRALENIRDERATPLFSYMLVHVDHRGPLTGIYVRAIEALGILKDPAGVPALREALYRGEWWAPRRTARLRRTAAAALARIGTAEAGAVLDEAVQSGPRLVRSAARAHAPGRQAGGAA